MSKTLSILVSAIHALQDAIDAARDPITVLKRFLPTAEELTNLVPVQIDLISMIKFIGCFVVASFLLGIFGRLLFGKQSNTNHALSSAMGIFFMLVVSTAIYVTNPTVLAQFISPLPFVAFSGDYLVIFPLFGSDFSTICNELLSMIILAFLVNILDAWISKGKSILGWFLLRILTVALAMIVHIASTWFISTYIPGLCAANSPIILLCILLIAIFMGWLTVIPGIVLGTAIPFFKTLFTFFFTKLLGKQLHKAIYTTAVLTAVVAVLNRFDITLINITGNALPTYAPLMVVLLILWYLFGQLL